MTKGLWLLAAILSLPTAYARVNMEVMDDDVGIRFLGKPSNKEKAKFYEKVS